MRKILILILFLAIHKACPAAQRVETIDARTLDGTVVSVTEKNVTLTAADEKKTVLPRSDVAEITFAEPGDPMGRLGQGVLLTAAGDKLVFRKLTLEKGRVHLQNSVIGRVELPMENVRTIYMPISQMTPAQIEQRSAELLNVASASDRLIVLGKDDQWLPLEGVLKSITDDKVIFTWRRKDRTRPADSVLVIRLAAVATKPPALTGRLVGRDGTVVGFKSLSFSDGVFQFDTAAMGKHSAKRASVASLEFISPRVVLLADLPPVSATEYGFYDTVFRYRRNRSVGGGPLQIKDRIFATGLGVHSFCELTYKLNGAYEKFVAVVGIDDAVRPAGDATLTVLGDGKPLGKPLRLTGRDDARTLRLNVSGVDVLTIRVDFGDDKLDVADHVDIASARLIKLPQK